MIDVMVELLKGDVEVAADGVVVINDDGWKVDVSIVVMISGVVGVNKLVVVVALSISNTNNVWSKIIFSYDWIII